MYCGNLYRPINKCLRNLICEKDNIYNEIKKTSNNRYSLIVKILDSLINNQEIPIDIVTYRAITKNALLNMASGTVKKNSILHEKTFMSTGLVLSSLKKFDGSAIFFEDKSTCRNKRNIC